MKYAYIVMPLIAIALGGASCTTEQKTEALQVACTVDAIGVPLAEAVATAAAVTNPGAETANQVAQVADAPVHTQVQNDCAQLNTPN